MRIFGFLFMVVVATTSTAMGFDWASAVNPREEEGRVRVNIGAGSAAKLEQALVIAEQRFAAEPVRRYGRINAATVDVAAADLAALGADADLRRLTDYVERDGVVAIPEAMGLPLPRERERRQGGGGKGMAGDADGGEGLTPNDEYYDLQWGPACTDLERAWGRWGFAARDVIIAILDTGVDYTHPDLEGNVDTERGWDFVNNDADPFDGYGHGTSCAGIAAGVADNSMGVAGAINAMILPIKVLDDEGYGSWSDVVAGIAYAVDAGADVISMSIGGGYDSSLERACADARDAGVLVFAAAGNWGNDWPVYPATFTSVIGVGALEQGCSSVAYYSSRGFGDDREEGNVEIVAPGSFIYTIADAGRYLYRWGTSFACPLAAGIGAGYVSLSTWSNRDIRHHIQSNADPVEGWDEAGYGIVDAYPFAD